MPTPVQIGAATAAVGGGALGGYLIANGLSGNNKKDDIKEPSTPAVTLKANEINNYPLLDITTVDKLDHLLKPLDKDNEEWWKWAYENKYRKTVSNFKFDDLFSGVKLGYSTTSVNSTSSGTNLKETALNQACEAAYKKTKDHFKFGSTDYLLLNIGLFCTKDKQGFDISTPKFESFDDTYTATGDYLFGVLSKSSNKTKLVKREKGSKEYNKFWWEWAYKNRLAVKDGLTSLFNSVNSGYNETPTTLTALNNACDEAYKKEKADLAGSDGSKKLLKEIAKFCGKENNLTLDLPDEDTEPNPEFLGDNTNTTYPKGLGNVANNKTKLVDPDKNTSKWWEWAFRNRFKKKPKDFDIHETFKKVTEAFSSDTSVTHLNQVCKEAYKKVKSDYDSGDQLLKNVKEFCAKPKGTTLDKPEA